MTIKKIKRIFFKKLLTRGEYISLIEKNINNLSNNINGDYWDLKYLKYCKLFNGNIQNINTILLGYTSISSNINYYLDRGYSKELSKRLLKNKQSTNTINAIIKKNNCTLEEAERIFKERQTTGQKKLKSRSDYIEICKKRGNSNNYKNYLKKINPVTGKNFTISEAKKYVCDKQSKAAKCNWFYIKSGQKKYISPWSYEYYLTKGLSLSEAINERLRKGYINSLESYILKYGKIKGTEKFNKRKEKWINTLNSKTDEEKNEILRKKLTRGYLFYSKVAYDFFIQLDFLIKDLKLKTFFGKNEYYIYDSNKKIIRFYDFAIPELNIIIEYNGSHCHVNIEKLTEDEIVNWINPYNNKNAAETLKYDNIKLDIAKKRGFKVYTIWDTDCVNTNLNKFKKIIYDEINKKRNN